MTVMLCFNFMACSNEDEVEPNEQQKPKEYLVSLGFTGEINVTESPLSRTETEEKTDLYGFAVYSCPNIEGQTEYADYAYGLFDDISLANIKLVEGYKYKFITTMIVNGKNVINCSAGQYSFPFMINLKNSFTLSNSWPSYIEMRQSLNPPRSKADRYYGELEFIPSEENTKAEIYMKRTVFGAKFIAKNLTEGKLTIEIEDGASTTLTPEEDIDESVYSMQSVAMAFAMEDYSEKANVSIKWEKADGVVIPLGDHQITFKRNKLTTITIKVSDIASDNDVTIELEDVPMGEGDDITIENGEIVDTNVGTEGE